MSAQPASVPRGARLTGPERREQVLDTLLGMVSETGWSSVSIDAVARAAGITRPVVYGHFTDLRGLLHALMDREYARAMGQLALVVPSTLADASPREVTIGALRGYLEAVQSAPATWRITLMPLEGTPDLLQERIAATRAGIRVQLGALIAAGLEQAGVDLEVDLELAAHMVQSFAEDSARLILTDPEGYPIDRILAFARQLLLPLP